MTPQPLPQNLSLGPVRLRVADAGRALGFYRDLLGLELVDDTPDRIGLGAGGETLLELEIDAAATPKPRGSTGLFHAAILLPERNDLAATVERLRGAGARFGASDHLVSEALYLWDPDGNGIEIYRDRPRSEWRWQDGRVALDTLPLNIPDLLGKRPPGEGRIMPAGTKIGHVHLQVGDLEAARRFYIETLGFDLVATYPGALFVSAGGYHHHLGLNIWESADGAPPPKGSVGLLGFEVRLPDSSAVEALANRLGAAGIPVERMERGFAVLDPWRNRLDVVVAPAG
jgi:catechol 2,3-dioxygenase